MSTYTDRADAAKRAHIAEGIRKDFAGKYDFEGVSDEDVIAAHHAQYGADLDPKDYAETLEAAYGSDYKAPSMTLGERAGELGEAAKEIAKGSVPYVVAEAPLAIEAGAKMAGKAVLGAAAAHPAVQMAKQAAFAGGHLANMKIDQLFEDALRGEQASVPFPHVGQTVARFYDMLQPGLSAKGWSDDRIRDEARKRAFNIARGYTETTRSMQADIDAMDYARKVAEPAGMAADAVFMGAGAPLIEGIVQKGLVKLGMETAVKTAAGTGAGLLGSAARTGAGTVAKQFAGGLIKSTTVGGGIGALGMAAHGATEGALRARLEGKSPQEVTAALVENAKSQGVQGLGFGAGLGALLHTGVSAAAAPFSRYAAKAVEKSVLEASNKAAEHEMRGMEAEGIRLDEQIAVAKSAAARDAEMLRKAGEFRPDGQQIATLRGVPEMGRPAKSAFDIATTIVQMQYGDKAARSAAGLQAATEMGKKIQLWDDANATLAEPRPFTEQSPAAAPQAGAQQVGENQMFDAVNNAGQPIRMQTEPNERLLESAVPVNAPPVRQPLPGAQPGDVNALNMQVDTRGRDVPVTPVPAKAEVLGPEAVQPLPAPVRVPETAPARETIKAALDEVKAKGQTGYTFDPDTFATVAEEGKVVTLKGDEVKGMPAPEQVEAFRDAHRNEIEQMKAQGQKPSIGVFAMEDKPGVWSIDLNTRVPSHEEAQAIGRATGQESYADLGPGGEWRSNPRVKSPKNALARVKLSQGVTMTDEGLHIESGLTHKGAKFPDALDEIVRSGDEHEVPVTATLRPLPMGNGGTMSVEKQMRTWGAKGFRVVEQTFDEAGKPTSAAIRREPAVLPAKQVALPGPQQQAVEAAIENPQTPAERNLAAPAQPAGPGRAHQLNVWADANIAAAKERLAKRQTELPESERTKRRQAGFIGEGPEGPSVNAYDFADFADHVNIGANTILKYGLNKVEWIEHMVKELGDSFRKIANDVYAEAVAVFNARRPNGLDDVRRVTDEYTRKVGLGSGATRHDVYLPLDVKFMTRAADAYEMLENAKPDTPEWKAAKQSYDHLNQEIAAQYDAIIEAGYSVEFGADPYPTSADMRADVAQNKRIKAFAAPEGHHPFMTAEQTNKFRAVHDFYGHAAEGYEFGPRGEDAAFRKHATTLSNKAIPALATETRGQNAWVNFKPENAKLEPKDRPFAEQKFGLVPEWVYDDVVKARVKRAPSNKLGAGFSRAKGTDPVAAAEQLSRGVQSVSDPADVRARFTADGNSTVNEMMKVSPQSATWYHDDIAKMHEATAERLPEVHTPGGQALFDLLLGFTSPQKPVVDNYAIAYQMADDFFRTGKVPMLQRFGQEINTGSRKWVPKLNTLIEQHGGNLESLRDYLLTKDEKGVYNVTKEFGPKVGPFTLNIQGIHDQVTVDLWIVRRLRRLTGKLFKNAEGKRVFNDNEAPTREERRAVEDSIRELGQQTGLDHDAIQAILWDNEKMMWDQAGYAAPRIPFSGAAEIVFKNMDKNARALAKKHVAPVQGELRKAG